MSHSETQPSKSGTTETNELTDWYIASRETVADPLVDSGVGNPYIIRSFEFNINPMAKGIPTKQELFNIHWQQLKTQLWKDGLKAREDIAPRLHIDKEKQKYYIMLVCEPKFNNTVLETPKTLQEVFKPN